MLLFIFYAFILIQAEFIEPLASFFFSSLCQQFADETAASRGFIAWELYRQLLINLSQKKETAKYLLEHILQPEIAQRDK